MTISGSARGSITKSSSKFFAHAYPVNSLDKVKDRGKLLIDKYPDASHICYAYRLFIKDRLDEFCADADEPKGSSGLPILNQLKKLGCSCDWSRNRFTMDKDLSEAVIKTFVQLYNKKIIYKDTKLVNWDTKLETAISDLEVEQREVQSNLFYIKYKIENEDNFITNCYN